MVTDQQVRRLFKLMQKEKTFGIAAAKAGMDEKTARKYCRQGRLPGEIGKDHDWRTRQDPFDDVWAEIETKLEANPGFESKTLFEYLQRRHPGRFSDGQLRTLQRRVKVWRATTGKAKEVFFPQVHRPGRLGQSDFTHMDKLGVTIAGKPFGHMMYHFVLTYSNWEAGTICFSESFESLSEGLQNALWELGGVPRIHRGDSLSAAVQKLKHPEEFTARYKDLLDYYGIEGGRTNPYSPHELGDAEQRHYRFKNAMEQALLLRGGRDFASLAEYELFLRKLFKQLNAGRKQRLHQEIAVLRALPTQRLDSSKTLRVKVGPGSTIRINNNVYSVDSRLIGETINVRLHADHLDIWYGQKMLDTLPRLKGRGKHKINYRHVIDSLVRKPGAFENYRFHDDLFPTSRFRIAYDNLKARHAQRVAARKYLNILHLAARYNEALVDDALRELIDKNMEISDAHVQQLALSKQCAAPVTDIDIASVDLSCYDELLQEVSS